MEEKIEKNIREGIFTYGITIHDNMPPALFINSINSVINSYKEMQKKEGNIPIDIMISIDATSEEDFKKELENKDLDELRKVPDKWSKDTFLDNFPKNLSEEESEIMELLEDGKRNYYILDHIYLHNKNKKVLDGLKQEYEEIKSEEYKFRGKNKIVEKRYRKYKETVERCIDIIQQQIKNEEKPKNEQSNILKREYEKILSEEFKRNKEIKRKYIEIIKQQITEEKLNINLNVIESEEKYGHAAVSRNRIIDICKTKYLAFLDGDDKIQTKALQRFINECRNNELGNPEGRKNYKNPEEIITGEADVIYLEGAWSCKAIWSNIYNIQTLRDKGIRFTKQIPHDDGYIKAAILQNNLKIVFAADENLGIISDYVASDSNSTADEKKFEPIIQLTNHLARHNKNGMQIWNEDFVREGNVIIDPNNIFGYFDSGPTCDGYGSFYASDGKIYLEEERIEVFSAIISSLILYPEVLVEGEDRNYFLEVRRKLREEIEENGNTNINILEILEKTKGYNEVFEKMKNNFADKDEFIKYFKEIGNYLDINNFEKRKIFNDVLLDLDIDKETNQLIKIKNPHLTGDASKIPEITDFDQYLSIEELKKKPENEQIRIMNKMLKGKFLPEDLPIEDKNIISKQNSIIQYMSNYYKENIPFILDVIAKTDSYRNDLIIRTLVNRNFNIEKTLGEIDFKPGRVLKEMGKYFGEAFYTALKNNDTKMLDLILNNKELDLKEIFDYSISCNGMERILGLIVDSDNVKLLDLFMEKEAKIPDIYHCAVDFAVKKNKMKTFNYLLDKYNRVDDVLHTIINNDNVALLDYLFKGEKLDLEKLEDHYLEFALMNEKTGVVEYLVNKIITDKKQLDGKSLLDFSLNFAMEHRQPKMLNYLFDKLNFDINKYNPFGHDMPYNKNVHPEGHHYGEKTLQDKTLLHYAIESGNQILFDNLINNKKIDLTKNVKDSDNHNAFNMLIELNKKIQNDIECKNGESDINDLNKNLYMVKSLYEKLNYKDRNGFGESLVKIKGLDINIKREAALERLLRAAECGVPETTESIINLCKEEEKKCGEKILDINESVSSKYLGIENDDHRYTPFQLALKHGGPKTAAIIYYHLNDEERKKNEDILAKNGEKIGENVFDELLFYCIEKDDIDQFSDLIDSDRVKFDTEKGRFNKKGDYESINDVVLKNKSINVMAEIILRSENRRKLYEYFMPKLDETSKSKLKETIIKVDKNKKSNQQTNEKKNHKKPSDFRRDNNLVGKIGNCSKAFNDLFPSGEDIYKKKFGKDLKNFSKDLDITLKEKENKNYIPDIRNNIKEAFRGYSQEETQIQKLDTNNNSSEELDVDSILERILNEKPIKSSSKKQTRTRKIKANKQKDINNSFHDGFGI